MENGKDKRYLIAEEPCGFMEDEEIQEERHQREKPEWMKIIMKALEEQSHLRRARVSIQNRR